eukprot:scaffold524474_cov16-Prasinocladus_malaysianus.AAC.1
MTFHHSFFFAVYWLTELTGPPVHHQHVNLGAIGANAWVVAATMANEVKSTIVAAWEARNTPKLL